MGIPSSPQSQQTATTSSERTAPRGRLWATPGDHPLQHAISKEYALDHGLPNPNQYPSWPNYPDERGLPVAIEARKRWQARLAKIQAKQPVTKEPVTAVGVQPVTCMNCGKELVRKSEHGPAPKFCSGACRVKHLRKASRGQA